MDESWKLPSIIVLDQSDSNERVILPQSRLSHCFGRQRYDSLLSGYRAVHAPIQQSPRTFTFY
jgi:hypothetical protein